MYNANIEEENSSSSSNSNNSSNSSSNNNNSNNSSSSSSNNSSRSSNNTTTTTTTTTTSASGETGLVDEDHVEIEYQEEGSDQDPRLTKKKQYHRHTQNQIHEMEAFFKECPHPDDKSHQEILENSQLRTENDKFRADNYHYQEAIVKAACPECGNKTEICEMSFEEHHLLLENARLQQEIDQLSALAEMCTGTLVMGYPVMAPSPPEVSVPPQAFQVGMGSIISDGDHHVYGHDENSSSGSIVGTLSDEDKTSILELSIGAMDELMRMAQAGEPLWMEIANNNGSSLALNLDEYEKTFPKGLWPKPIGFRTEASKETAIVVMNPINIVEMLLDVNKWSTMFAGIVARAMTSEVLSVGDIYEAVKVITAEFQVLSPLVSAREVAFARHCKKQGDGLWAVVDVSIDHILPNPEIKCRRRPSGCLIQELPNGYSKVTWVEHVEVDDKEEVHNLFKHLVTSGQALGANRWVSTLDRHCERLSNIMMATNFPSIPMDGSQMIMMNQGKSRLLKVADRMTRRFFGGLKNSSVDMWSALSNNSEDNVRVITRTSLDDPGRPTGGILCAATTFWVPFLSNTVFDFLRDENNRTKWDFLTIGGHVEKMSQIANGRDSRNNVSLLKCTKLNAQQTEIMIIQETSTDPTASFVLYAPVDGTEIEMLLNGGDSDYVALIPSGFAVVPDGTGHPGGEGGSLITVALQFLADLDPNVDVFSYVATIENLMVSTVEKIKAIFHCPTA